MPDSYHIWGPTSHRHYRLHSKPHIERYATNLENLRVAQDIEGGHGVQGEALSVLCHVKAGVGYCWG